MSFLSRTPGLLKKLIDNSFLAFHSTVTAGIICSAAYYLLHQGSGTSKSTFVATASLVRAALRNRSPCSLFAMRELCTYLAWAEYGFSKERSRKCRQENLVMNIGCAMYINERAGNYTLNRHFLHSKMDNKNAITAAPVFTQNVVLQHSTPLQIPPLE